MWQLHTSRVVHWLWFAVARVPGGRTRPMITDDFGNLVDLPIEAATVSFGKVGEAH